MLVPNSVEYGIMTRPTNRIAEAVTVAISKNQFNLVTVTTPDGSLLQLLRVKAEAAA